MEVLIVTEGSLWHEVLAGETSENTKRYVRTEFDEGFTRAYWDCTWTKYRPERAGQTFALLAALIGE